MSPGSSYPGVYVEEIPGGTQTIVGVSTSETGFVDVFSIGPLDLAMRITSFTEFEATFGGLDSGSEASYGIQQYFLNGGSVAWVVRVEATHEPPSSEWKDAEGAEAILGRGGQRKGIYALSGTGFNILCLPAAAHLSATGLKRVYDAAMKFCKDERAFLIVDIPPEINSTEKVTGWFHSTNSDGIERDKNAAVYFPRVTTADPLNENQPRNVGPSGTLAGLYARIDAQRGVWKAPAGTDAKLLGVNLVATLTENQNGALNKLAINTLRNFSTANVCWGARTLAGADQQAGEWGYIPVRRTALFIEESIDRGTKWVVFEPNDEPLWAQIRLNVSAFLHKLFRDGALQGRKATEAYFIKCDEQTTTRNDINNGTVNILVGFAPLKAAEFIIIRIQQRAGQTDSSA